MRLNHLQSDQFAGITDRELDFAPGLNVVVGDNECGKSTLISAMFHGLTTPAKLDRRRGKDFINRCFPTDQGLDSIDVTLDFTQGDTDYHLEKVWDKTDEATQTKLKQSPGGLLRESKAEDKLRELLSYGPGVYDYLVFGRQHNEEEILNWCYDFFGANGDDDMEAVKKTLSSAVSAAGGISPEKFQKLVEEQLKELSGHWDFDRNGPEKGRELENAWAKGCGTILTAYYAWRQAQTDCAQAERQAGELRSLREQLEALEQQRQTASQERDRLLALQGKIENRAKTQALLEGVRRELTTARGGAQRWPELEARIAEGRQLLAWTAEAKNRKERAALAARLSDILALTDEIRTLEQATAGGEDLPEACKTAEKLVRDRESARGTLSAARLRAELRLEPGVTVTAESADGETREVTGTQTLDVDGFVALTIPGVGTLRVAPQTLDVDGLQARIASDQKALEELLHKHTAADESALQALAEAYRENAASLRQKRQALEVRLDGETAEVLQNRLAAIPLDEGLELPETLEADTAAFLRRAGQRTLDAAAAGAETELNALREKYGTLEALQEKLIGFQKDEAAYLQQLAESAGETLDEATYRQQLTAQKAALEALDQRNVELLQRKGALEDRELPNLDDLRAETDRLRERLEAEQGKYRAYETILRDFQALQETAEDTLAGFTERFGDLLGKLTGSRLQVDAENGLLLRSGDNALATGELLSEGTKKTLLLAFRLAVLESFFPEGGGLVVLDDDLLDMDPGRRQQAAALLQAFAEKNQVIFTTCDPAMADLLGGNRIQL